MRIKAFGGTGFIDINNDRSGVASDYTNNAFDYLESKKK